MLHMSPVCVAVVSVLLIAAVTCKTDYCELCSLKKTHTMCKYPKPGPGKGCAPYSVHNYPMTFEEKKKLVDIHNELRNTVAQGSATEGDPGPQPSAKNMRLMVSSPTGACRKIIFIIIISWDEELEIIATRWADQCQHFKTDKPHDECRDSERFAVGQNIAAVSQRDASPQDPVELAESWFIGEVSNFNNEWVHKYLGQVKPGEKISHYTQLVWGDSYLVGCGRVVFEEKDNVLVTRLVCNYGPGGNIIGMPLYKVGDPCSECPDNTTCKHPLYTGLCASKCLVQHEVSALDHAATEAGFRQISCNVIASVVYWSEFPGTDPEIPDSIPGSSRIFL
uniref:SCP domain-containing protein n=1 Tax=Timema douglasi TaxID=61478 RepID=A0A7R8Z631_TIMDO|nr:unnamed protein product [Timema douglasi]